MANSMIAPNIAHKMEPMFILVIPPKPNKLAMKPPKRAPTMPMIIVTIFKEVAYPQNVTLANHSHRQQVEPDPQPPGLEGDRRTYRDRRADRRKAKGGHRFLDVLPVQQPLEVLVGKHELPLVRVKRQMLGTGHL